ncbi:MarR family transcriptional regulator [Jiella sp. CQZ9-1]|uniref:MarR family transcriptional regulator n=2 Tax=Jiella flava TaxID=2816857 RepID=A0A939JSH1_9HYPH|nr:MarR family transcriptional regulator [Jiella flava]
MFKRVVQEALNFDRDLASEYGLALTDLMCLIFLEASTEPVSAKMLAEHVTLSTGATTALIDRLEREGFIERRPNPNDRRGVIIALVPERAGRVLDDQRALSLRLRAAYDELSVQDVDGMMRFMHRLLEGNE